MNYALESQRMQAEQVMQNEAQRDPRRGRKWMERAVAKTDGFSTKENFHNKLDVRMKLYLCDSVNARLKELAEDGK